MSTALVLRPLGWAATAASVGHVLDPGEYARLAGALGNPDPGDAHTIEHLEAATWRGQPCTGIDHAAAV